MTENLFAMTCPTCGGSAGVLGVLARKIIYRCRHCGMQCSRLVEKDEARMVDDILYRAEGENA